MGEKEEFSNIKTNEVCHGSSTTSQLKKKSLVGFKEFIHKFSFDSSYTMAEGFKYYLQSKI